MIDIYGTIGPACADRTILAEMFREGMTGIRLNTSHTSLRDAEPQIAMIHEAAALCGIKPKLLIDMQGPELRLGRFAPMTLQAGSRICFAVSAVQQQNIPAVPVAQLIWNALHPGEEVLLDDGKILLSVTDDKQAVVIRGGLLTGGKSIAIRGIDLNPPAMTEQDYRNLQDAVHYGVTGVMQPFVRSAEDLKQVRSFMNRCGGEKLSLLAKIENVGGVKNLAAFFPYADEIVIARGDLGNAVPLWELPKIQKQIEEQCKAAGMPFMVVTQMLASMEQNPVPTRAEVSDIYNAVCDGASSVMVTGETAVGRYPVEVIRYLTRTVRSFTGNQRNGDS